MASPLTVKTYLGDHDLGDGMTVPRYLARLAAEATTIVNAPDYARMVSELHARRALIGVAAELEAQAHDPPAGTPVERLIEGAEGPSWRYGRAPWRTPRRPASTPSRPRTSCSPRSTGSAPAKRSRSGSPPASPASTRTRRACGLVTSGCWRAGPRWGRPSWRSRSPAPRPARAPARSCSPSRSGRSRRRRASSATSPTARARRSATAGS